MEDSRLPNTFVYNNKPAGRRSAGKPNLDDWTVWKMLPYRVSDLECYRRVLPTGLAPQVKS